MDRHIRGFRGGDNRHSGYRNEKNKQKQINILN